MQDARNQGRVTWALRQSHSQLPCLRLALRPLPVGRWRLFLEPEIFLTGRFSSLYWLAIGFGSLAGRKRQMSHEHNVFSTTARGSTLVKLLVVTAIPLQAIQAARECAVFPVSI
jgi:hypothetical protein